ncbi:prepilin peptidase [Pseudonocardia sp. GCM10023141]|uniref:prepilin peptidase n=1 Tax=Pseudonocardia sp. GCM10023141 TaxID=3252653 RepID=UPI003621910B
MFTRSGYGSRAAESWALMAGTPSLAAVLVSAGVGVVVGAVLAATITPRALVRPTRPRPLIAVGSATTGLTFAVLAARFGGVGLLAFCCLAAAGIVLSSIDVLERRLPGVVVLPSYLALVSLLTVGALTKNTFADLLRALSASALVIGAYLVVALVSRGGLGAGDVKLGGLLGLASGWQSWEAVLGGTLLGWTAAALTLLTIRCAKKRPWGSVPMGPFLLFGSLLGIMLY